VISQQLQQYDGRLAVCPPKTAHSTRVIALDHTTAVALAAQDPNGPGGRDASNGCHAR